MRVARHVAGGPQRPYEPAKYGQVAIHTLDDHGAGLDEPAFHDVKGLASWEGVREQLSAGRKSEEGQQHGPREAYGLRPG